MTPSDHTQGKPRAGKKALYADPKNKPSVLPVNPDGIPADLKDAARWVLWKLAWKANKDGTGKWDKVPVTTAGRGAKTNDPRTWGTFEAVLAAYRKLRYDGIGFVLGNRFAGVDLDDVRDPATGAITAAWAADLVRKAGTYTDVSPSGTGVKLFGVGTWMGDWHKRPHPSGTGEIEIYSAGRYFTVTGRPADGSTPVVNGIWVTLDDLADQFAPETAQQASVHGGCPVADDEVLRRIRASKQREKFAALFDRGDASAYGADESAADLALCSILAFWVGPDAERIDRLVRRSGLMRDKWDSPRKGSTYGRNTIDAALAGRTAYYDWQRVDNPTPNATGNTTSAGAGDPTGPHAFVPELVRASDVTPVSIPWLWPGRIALGRATLVAGRPGAGKSLLLCDLAARVSKGTAWPLGSPAPTGDVIFMSAEDDPADTLVPRLQAAGADLGRVRFLKGMWAKGRDGKPIRRAIDLLAGVPQIEAAVATLPDLKVLVVDPIGSYLGRGVDSHRDNEVRGALDGVNRLANERGFALILVAHVNKSGMNQFADDAVLGSRAFTGLVRSVHHLIRDPKDKKRSILAPGKTNVAATQPALAYTLESVALPTGEQPRIVWDPDPIDAVADDFIGTGAGRNSGSAPERECRGRERSEAEAFLRDLLAGGPMPVPEIKKAVAVTEFSWATAKRAKDAAGITGKSEQGAFVAGKKPPRWWGIGDDWEIPPEAAQPPVPADEPPTSQAREPDRDEGRAEPPETPAKSEQAHAEERVEPVREKKPRKSRTGSRSGGSEPDRKTKAKTRASPEQAQQECEVHDASAQPELPFDDSADGDR